MGKPSDPAEHCLCVLQNDISLFFKSPMHPLGQTPDFKEVPVANPCCCGGESISDNINLLCSWLYLHPAFFVCRKQFPYLTDLP